MTKLVPVGVTAPRDIVEDSPPGSAVALTNTFGDPTAVVVD